MYVPDLYHDAHPRSLCDGHQHECPLTWAERPRASVMSEVCVDAHHFCIRKLIASSATYPPSATENVESTGTICGSSPSIVNDALRARESTVS